MTPFKTSFHSLCGKESLNNQKLRPGPGDPLDPIISAILAETLRTSLGLSGHKCTDFSTTFLETRPVFALVDVLLENAGWCPFQILKLSLDVRVRYYLSYFIPFDSNDHSGCSRDGCNAIPSEMPLPHFEPFHTSADCVCGYISIPDATIEPITDQGDIPVLTFYEEYGGQRYLKILSTNASRMLLARRSSWPSTMGAT
ncbi:hypothetical protein K469DRAFT_773775 [Zopfia rhizophila CBS 207.26]|uniref:Uncharacterized protein n=1 Tax=Zopfia rhizophila CBS 207.26 TaxID=1314779 RepID=A0A6A6EX17_9PEZI|nr:hypothetical protein K469DRAFT_773775 [Zopfia rhizophila CBS 207.26]